MIVPRTPDRVSFVGDGTDLPCFYRREGACRPDTIAELERRALLLGTGQTRDAALSWTGSAAARPTVRRRKEPHQTPRPYFSRRPAMGVSSKRTDAMG
jgi:hypothetical protein